MADCLPTGNMAKAWVKRWSPKVKGDLGSLISALRVHNNASIEGMTWDLPPSKSHAIRLLALAAQSEQTVVLHGMTNAGQDVISMRRCLRQMGVQITDLDRHGNPLHVSSNQDDQPSEGSVSWSVVGVGPSGLKAPISVLHAGNSGTALRILMAMCGRFDVPVMVDGDASLRARNHDTMVQSLRDMGASVSRGTGVEGLPLLIQGPMAPSGKVSLDVSTSSQPVTAWCLAAPALPADVGLELNGSGVSLRHSGLTKTMCVDTGAPEGIGAAVLSPWTPVFANPQVEVPRDASMLAFACLAAKATDVSVHIGHLPRANDALGHELLLDLLPSLGLNLTDGTLTVGEVGSQQTVDLRDANDLITPLAALLALGKGGKLVGAPHAAYKETDRTVGTVNLLKQFGLEASYANGELTVPGDQSVVCPNELVETYGDHRMQMTALVLALACRQSVLVKGATLHEVADPEAVKRWSSVGAEIEAFLHQPW